MIIPKSKSSIINKAEAEVKEISDQFSFGLLTEGERKNKAIDIWSRANDKVSKAMMNAIGQDITQDSKGKKIIQESFNSI